MKLNEILMAILNNTNSMKEKGIKDIYSEMQECLIQLDQNSADEKTSTQKFYLKAFVNVMQRMADELSEARFKYESLEKERFKNQKCEKLAEDIKIFREECYTLREKVNKTKEMIRKQKMKSEILFQEQQGLRISLVKATQKKRKNKQQYEKLKSLREESEGNINKVFDSILEEKPSSRKSGHRLLKGHETQRRITGESREAKQLKDVSKKRPSSTNNSYRCQDYF